MSGERVMGWPPRWPDQLAGIKGRGWSDGTVLPTSIAPRPASTKPKFLRKRHQNGRCGDVRDLVDEFYDAIHDPAWRVPLDEAQPQGEGTANGMELPGRPA